MGRRGGRGWECTPTGVQLGQASQISNKDRQAEGQAATKQQGQASPTRNKPNKDRQAQRGQASRGRQVSAPCPGSRAVSGSASSVSFMDRQAAARPRTRTDAIAHPADQTARRWRTCRVVRRSAGSPSQRFVALLATFFAAGFLVAAFLVAALLVADFATFFPAFSPPVFFASFFPSGPRPVLASVFT